MAPVVASDKLFFWLFQGRSDRLQPLVAGLIDSMEGYSFTAPAIKELEVRLDGLFLPPPEQLAEKPALILEAQMAAAPDFLLRLYAESALLLRHQQRQGQPLRHWRVVVICPSRDLAFGDPMPVREFLQERVLWIELAPERLPPEAPPLQRALGLLLLPEPQVSASAIRRAAAGTTLSGEIDTVIAAILVARFSGRSIPELCAMGGITLDDFTSSAIYREIFGLGRQEEAVSLALRQLQRRCGTLSLQQQARIQALPLAQLEALADALLDFQGTEDLAAWLEAQPG
jgi:predicted transposase YdaD